MKQKYIFVENSLNTKFAHIRQTIASYKESLAREIATFKDEPTFESHLVIEELHIRLSKKPELLAQVVEEM